MAFTASAADILRKLEDFVVPLLGANWAAEPPAARAALLVREALGEFAARQYPGSSSEGAALDPGSRRRLSLLIHSAPASHRVEVWGFADGDEAVPAATPHTPHSWVVLARPGGAAPALEAAGSTLASAGLKRLAERNGPALALSLWQGSSAPDGCPDCRRA
jgi:hypothetical protein